jgi:hypothetical protein
MAAERSPQQMSADESPTQEVPGQETWITHQLSTGGFPHEQHVELDGKQRSELPGLDVARRSNKNK